MIFIGELATNTVMTHDAKFSPLAGVVPLMDSSEKTQHLFSAMLNILQESTPENQADILPENQGEALNENTGEVQRGNRSGEKNKSHVADTGIKEKTERRKYSHANSGFYPYHCNLLMSIREDIPENEKLIDTGLQGANRAKLSGAEVKAMMQMEIADKTSGNIQSLATDEPESKYKVMQEDMVTGEEEIPREGVVNRPANQNGSMRIVSATITPADSMEKQVNGSKAAFENEASVLNETEPRNAADMKTSMESPEKEGAKMRKESGFGKNINQIGKNENFADEKDINLESFAEISAVKPNADIEHTEKKAVESTDTKQSDSAQESIAAQISKNSGRNIARGIKEFKLKLKPDTLGEVTINLSFNNKKIDMRIQSETEDTKDLINTQIGVLKDDLEQSGYNLDSLIVEAGTNPENGGGDYSGGHWQGEHNGNANHQAMDRGERYSDELNIANKKPDEKELRVYMRNGAINYKA